MNTSKSALSLTAFLTLLLIALMMGSNHVAARFAFENGVDVATAVTFVSAAGSGWACDHDDGVVTTLVLRHRSLAQTMVRANQWHRFF